MCAPKNNQSYVHMILEVITIYTYGIYEIKFL